MSDFDGKLLLALFAGSISLLLVLSTRNATVSERMRKALEFARAPGIDAERLACLREQARRFRWRYSFNLYSVLGVLGGIFLLTAGCILSLWPVPFALVKSIWSASGVLLIAALWLAAVDFIRSSETLDLEFESAAKIPSPPDPSRSEPATAPSTQIAL
jgi:hypothetical protein